MIYCLPTHDLTGNSSGYSHNQPFWTPFSENSDIIVNDSNIFFKKGSYLVSKIG